MTYDEIMAMEAGRELDALVAELIIGEPKPKIQEHNIGALYADILRGHELPKSPLGAWYATMDFDDGDIPYWEPIHYSTDIAAVWDVVEKIRSYGHEVYISTAEDEWGCTIMNDNGEPDENHRITLLGAAHENDAALAICRAALLAVG